MRSSGVPGAALVVLRDGQVVYAAGFGTAGGGRPLTTETPFVLGSVSKPVTALAVMRLVEDGILDLDAPAARYLPGFDIGRDTLALGITVRHLLSHRSGIPRAAGFQRFHPRAPAPSAYPDVKLVSTPGSGFEYSNLNHVLLGRLIAHDG
jgi:CubicO group peptidase (beta-lactamase class C family)